MLLDVIYLDLRKLVTTGNCSDAITLLQKEYPAVWEQNWHLQLRLQAQHFIELVRKGDSGIPEALSYARSTLGRHMLDHGDSAREVAYLQEVLGLIAYVDPSKSPLAHLLEQTQRDNTFDVLNRTLRGALGIVSCGADGSCRGERRGTELRGGAPAEPAACDTGDPLL